MQATQGGKGKKKNKETKISLDEFNQFDAPHGHAVLSLRMTGLDWAEAMTEHDNNLTTETAQIVVPSKPRAQRGPAVDLDSLPTEPPFKVSLFNLPMSVDEQEIRDRHFKDLDIIHVETSKSSTTVELASRDHLYEALGKDGFSIRGRTINVCLFGQQPPSTYGSDRYGGGRGGGNSYGDRYGAGGAGSYARPRSDDRYGDRSATGGGFGRDRDRNNFSAGAERGFGAGRTGGYNQQRGGFGAEGGFADRGNFRDNIRGSYTSGGGEPASESNDWRARPNIARQTPPPPAPSSNSGPGPRLYVPPRPQEPSQQSHQLQQPRTQTVVPPKPRAPRGPAVDLDSLPTEPPFKVSIFNLPISVEEQEIRDRHFKDLDIIHLETDKSSTTIELANRDHLYEALGKDGLNIGGRRINVCLFGQQPSNNYGSDQYGGGRGGGNSYGDRNGGAGGNYARPRPDDRYPDRSGGFGRDRNNYPGGADRGFGAGRPGGYNQQRGGYGGERFVDRGNFRDNIRGSQAPGGGEPSPADVNDWRARPNVTRQTSPPAPPSNSGPGQRPYAPPRPQEPSQQPNQQL